MQRTSVKPSQSQAHFKRRPVRWYTRQGITVVRCVCVCVCKIFGSTRRRKDRGTHTRGRLYVCHHPVLPELHPCDCPGQDPFYWFPQSWRWMGSALGKTVRSGDLCPPSSCVTIRREPRIRSLDRFYLSEDKLFPEWSFSELYLSELFTSNVDCKTHVSITCLSPGTVNSSAGRPSVTPHPWHGALACGDTGWVFVEHTIIPLRNFRNQSKHVNMV